MRRLVGIAAALLAIAPAAAYAQPQTIDPYGDTTPPATQPTPPDATPPPAGAVESDQDPEIREAVAASLVERAKALIAEEDWGDAQELLGEAIAESPDGAAAAEAHPLLDQVNAKLGITTAQPPTDDGHPPPVGPGGDHPPPILTAPPPPVETPPAATAGKAFMWHVGLIGGVVGGLIGYAASAENVSTGGTGNSGRGILPGVLLGAAGGLAIGASFRHSTWITHDKITVADSFAAMGLVGSLELGALMQPARNEAYAVNGMIGTIAGVTTGLIVAKHHAITTHRMMRVDLWAALGAVTPWVIYGAANGSSSGAQRATGALSLVGLFGGAWLGFHLTRNWAPAVTADSAPIVTVAPAPHGGTIGLAGTW